MKWIIEKFFVGKSPQAAPASEQSEAPEAPEKPLDPLAAARDFLHSRPPETLPSDILHPDKTGLGIVTADELMHANSRAIAQVLDAFTDKKYISDFDEHIVEFIRRVAFWMGPIPASRSYHHTARGGLFTHSLAVGLGALNMGLSRNVTYASAPRNRDADNLAWQLITFICGMLHDIGKIHSIGRVHAYAVSHNPTKVEAFKSSASPVYSTIWEPSVQSFEGWAKTNRVQSYFIDYDSKDSLPHEDYTQRYLMPLVPRKLLAYIYYSNPVIRQQFEDFINNPGSTAKTPIFGVVQDADHINVSQALDPRRKPGSIELGALIMRRFAEFASEVPWNLPTSPFIYANTQIQVGDRLRYYGLPYFVVSEASISQFEEFLLSRPTFGVSVDARRITELIFNALETHQVMHRTVDVLLPSQKPNAELADYIPASNATVRFSPRQIKSIQIQPNSQPDALVDLAVVPIKIRVPPTKSLDAPTLSFDGTPAPGSAAVLPSAIVNGSLEPADHNLRHDEDFMAGFRSEAAAAKAKGMTHAESLNVDDAIAAEIDAIPSLSAAQKRGQGRKSRSSQPKEPPVETEGKKGTSEEPPSKQLDLLTANQPEAPTATQAGSQPEQPTAKPMPLWLSVFHEMSENPDKASLEAAWAGVWLYLREFPQSGYKSVTLPNGYHGFQCSALPQILRSNIAKDLREAGLHIKVLTPHWQNVKIDTESPLFGKLFELTKDQNGAHVFRLNPKACELIEEALHSEGQGGAR